MIKVGIQGDVGSFSEEAAHAFIEKQSIDDYDIHYLISSENVLSNVDKGTVDFGIFAIENAQGGVVIESIEALANYRCQIHSMFHILVDQNLLALPGVTTEAITSIHSHQQALRQCREYLANHFWGCPLVEEEDTAKSAKQLKEGGLSEKSAVIANKACADLYGLEILAKNIHDLKNNLTLFLAITRHQDG